MIPGSPEIKEVFHTIYPNLNRDNLDPVWYSKVANKLGWTTARVRTLYKDSRATLHDHEGQILRKHLRNSTGHNPMAELHPRTKTATLKKRKTDDDFIKLLRGFRDVMDVVEERYFLDSR